MYDSFGMAIAVALASEAIANWGGSIRSPPEVNAVEDRVEQKPLADYGSLCAGALGDTAALEDYGEPGRLFRSRC